MDGKGGIVLIYDNEIKDNQIINYFFIDNIYKQYKIKQTFRIVYFSKVG